MEDYWTLGTSTAQTQRVEVRVVLSSGQKVVREERGGTRDRPRRAPPSWGVASMVFLVLALARPRTGYASARVLQAPHPTPAGDPTIRDDTLYRLAVDPAQHPGEDYIFLLTDGVARFEPDGRGSRTRRQVVQLFSAQAVQRWGELELTYTNASERLTLNWARVVRPDGTVISGQPVREQESATPVAGDAPVYSEARVRRISVAGLAPGMLLDYSYTVERVQPAMPGDFGDRWYLTRPKLVRRARYVLDVPATLQVRIKERNIGFARRTVLLGGRRVSTWATAEVPKVQREPFAADSNGVDQWIAVAAPITWADVARWYAALVRDRYAVPAALDSALVRVVSGATSLNDSLRALHRWVAQDFRYVSLSLGLGGYQPRLPGAVFDSKYGDCKDKATLFIALAQRLGQRAYPVLLRSSGGIERDLPSLRAFDHMIAALERPGGGGFVYLDLTAELAPFGTLPPDEQGEFGLVVRPDGRGEEVTLPAEPLAASHAQSLLEGELAPDGSFRGRFTVEATGRAQYALRYLFGHTPTPAERDRFARTLLGEVYPDAVPDSVALFDGRDLSAAAKVRVVFHGGRAATRSGDTEILLLPFHEAPVPELLAQLESSGPRRFPIDAAAVIGPMTSSAELRVTLPPGWQTRLPAAATATSAFGTYAAEYRQDGQELRVVHRFSGTSGIQPPERIGELVTWLRDVSKADVHYVVVTP